jgi:hypothetical protein
MAELNWEKGEGYESRAKTHDGHFEIRQARAMPGFVELSAWHIKNDGTSRCIAAKLPPDLLKSDCERLHKQNSPKPEFAPVKPPEWWSDLYTDAGGNCWSDADSGL